MKIMTTERNWFGRVCDCYVNEIRFELVDDAKLGIDPRLHSALEMGVYGGLSKKEVTVALVGAGVGVVGAGLIAVAILDPEPTSKLGILLGGGVSFMAIGGLSVLRILTKNMPTCISLGNGFGISWGEPPVRHTDVHNYPPVYSGGFAAPPVDPYRPRVSDDSRSNEASF